MAADTEPRPTITKVWAKNFRSIEYAELELGPLTVLVGPNASGKSNLLDVLGFLADVARDGLEAAVIRRGGIGSIGRRSPGNRALAPEIGFLFEFPGGATIEYSVALARPNNEEYRVKREFARLQPTKPGDGPFEVQITNGRLIKPNLKEFIKNQENRGTIAVSVASRLMTEELGSQDLNLLSNGSSRVTTFLSHLYTERGSTAEGPYSRVIEALESARRNLSRIGMYRIFPNSLRDPQKVSVSYPMTPGGENIASTLQDMILHENRFLPDLKHGMKYAVPDIRDVRVRKIGSHYVVELYHKPDPEGRKGLWLDLSYESDGTIRLLAMLTAIFQEPSPSLVCLEDPETALHPGAMIMLAEDLKEAALRGQVVVATHSPDLINHLPVENIRAVTAEGGSTKVGKVAESQMKSLNQKLFTAGELHSMEGLYPVGVE